MLVARAQKKYRSEKIRKLQKGDLKPKMARVVACTPQKHVFVPHVGCSIPPNPEQVQNKQHVPTPTPKQSMRGVYATHVVQHTHKRCFQIRKAQDLTKNPVFLKFREFHFHPKRKNRGSDAGRVACPQKGKKTKKHKKLIEKTQILAESTGNTPSETPLRPLAFWKDYSCFLGSAFFSPRLLQATLKSPAEVYTFLPSVGQA
jgi:hypothetical protein